MELTQDERPIPLNCPKCPLRMRYVGTREDGTRIYTCVLHGEWHLAEGGLQQPTDASR